MTTVQAQPSLIDRYRDHLPFEADDPVISLGEGATPLTHAPILSEMVGAEVFIKYEGLNPTGSFKDRGMTMALSKAVRGRREGRDLRQHRQHQRRRRRLRRARRASPASCCCPRARSPSASSPRPSCTAPRSWPSTAISTTPCASSARSARPSPSPSSIRSIPIRLQGQKTATFEIIDVLGDAPDIHVLPVGNAGNISAYWMGYEEFHELGKATKRPRMVGFQAAGTAPIFYNKVVEKPETVATAIRIGNPASWKLASAAIPDSGGCIDIVTDAEILAAQRSGLPRRHLRRTRQRRLGPTGLLKYCPDGASTVVCVLTGRGLKDPETAIEHNDGAVISCAPDMTAIEEAGRPG